MWSLAFSTYSSLGKKMLEVTGGSYGWKLRVEVAGGSIEGIGAKESRSSRGENSSRALQNQKLKKAAEKNNDSRPQNVLRIRFLKKPLQNSPHFGDSRWYLHRRSTDI
jgi:hypothetical protein